MHDTLSHILGIIFSILVFSVIKNFSEGSKLRITKVLSETFAITTIIIIIEFIFEM
jgi:hypothetical protein